MIFSTMDGHEGGQKDGRELFADRLFACSPVSTVVLPELTTCLGPRSECAGLVATT